MSHNIAEHTSCVTHEISLQIGDNKNNRFHSINADIFKIISFRTVHINNAHSDIIIEYPRSV